MISAFNVFFETAPDNKGFSQLVGSSPFDDVKGRIEIK